MLLVPGSTRNLKSAGRVSISEWQLDAVAVAESESPGYRELRAQYVSPTRPLSASGVSCQALESLNTPETATAWVPRIRIPPSPPTFANR